MREQGPGHRLEFFFVNGHGPGANERRSLAGTVNHDFLFSGGELGVTSEHNQSAQFVP